MDKTNGTPSNSEKRAQKALKQWKLTADLSETEATAALGGEWKVPDKSIIDGPAPPVKQIHIYYKGQRLFTGAITPVGWSDQARCLSHIGLQLDHATYYDSKVNEITDWKQVYLTPYRAVVIIRKKGIIIVLLVLVLFQIFLHLHFALEKL